MLDEDLNLFCCIWIEVGDLLLRPVFGSDLNPKFLQEQIKLLPVREWLKDQITTKIRKEETSARIAVPQLQMVLSMEI